MLKRLLIPLLFSLSSYAADEQIKVHLMTEQQPLNCKLDSAVEIYVCDHNGKPILVNNNSYHFLALGTDDNGDISTPIIKKIVKENKTIYEVPENMADYKYPSMANASAEYMNKVGMVDNFLNGKGFDRYGKKIEKKKGSPEFEAAARLLTQKRDELKSAYDQAFKDSVYSLEMEDGQKIKCHRGASRELTKEQADYSAKYNITFQCGTYKCDPLIVNGKSYDSTLLYDSSPGAMGSTSIHLYDKDGLGPNLRIKTIHSSKIQSPLVDNSIFLNNPFGTYNPYAMYTDALPEKLGSDREKIAAYKNPYFQQMIEMQKNICTNSDGLEKLLEARKQLLKKVADLEMAEFIQVMADGSLVGNYIDPNKSAQYGCLYNGLILDPNAAKNLQKLKKNFYPDQKVDQTITLQRATELFNKAAGMKDIAWKYKYDGCYARAHLMARRFEAEGVRVDKVWIKGDLYVPGTDIRWNFHVAPIVYVEDEKGGIQKMVIDPSLFDKPVTVEEWDNRMSKNTAKGSVITAFPFPENVAAFERSSLSFSSSDPYLPRESINLSEDEKMNMSNQTMKQYKPLEPK